MANHLGNIRVTIDESGSVVTTDDYYPFGLQMLARGESPGRPGSRSYNIAFSGNQYKFGSKELDDENNLNLYHFEARRYDPVIARFTTIDPLTNIYPGLSPYAYVANNPLRFTDPTGMSIFDPKYYLNGVEIQGELIGQVSELAETDQENEKKKKERKQKSKEETGTNTSLKDPGDEFRGEDEVAFDFKSVLYALYNTVMQSVFSITPKADVSLAGQKTTSIKLPGTGGEISFDDKKVGGSIGGLGMNFYHNGDLSYSYDVPIVSKDIGPFQVSGVASLEYRFYVSVYNKDFANARADYYSSYFEYIYGD